MSMGLPLPVGSSASAGGSGDGDGRSASSCSLPVGASDERRQLCAGGASAAGSGSEGMHSRHHYDAGSSGHRNLGARSPLPLPRARGHSLASLDDHHDDGATTVSASGTALTGPTFASGRPGSRGNRSSGAVTPLSVAAYPGAYGAAHSGAPVGTLSAPRPGTGPSLLSPAVNAAAARAPLADGAGGTSGTTRHGGLSIRVHPHPGSLVTAQPRTALDSAAGASESSSAAAQGLQVAPPPPPLPLGSRRMRSATAPSAAAMGLREPEGSAGAAQLEDGSDRFHHHHHDGRPVPAGDHHDSGIASPPPTLLLGGVGMERSSSDAGTTQAGSGGGSGGLGRKRSHQAMAAAAVAAAAAAASRSQPNSPQRLVTVSPGPGFNPSPSGSGSGAIAVTTSAASSSAGSGSGSSPAGLRIGGGSVAGARPRSRPGTANGLLLSAAAAAANRTSPLSLPVPVPYAELTGIVGSGSAGVGAGSKSAHGSPTPNNPARRGGPPGSAGSSGSGGVVRVRSALSSPLPADLPSGASPRFAALSISTPLALAGTPGAGSGPASGARATPPRSDGSGSGGLPATFIRRARGLSSLELQSSAIEELQGDHHDDERERSDLGHHHDDDDDDCSDDDDDDARANDEAAAHQSSAAYASTAADGCASGSGPASGRGSARLQVLPPRCGSAAKRQRSGDAEEVTAAHLTAGAATNRGQQQLQQRTLALHAPLQLQSYSPGPGHHAAGGGAAAASLRSGAGSCASESEIMPRKRAGSTSSLSLLPDVDTLLMDDHDGGLDSHHHDDGEESGELSGSLSGSANATASTAAFNGVQVGPPPLHPARSPYAGVLAAVRGPPPGYAHHVAAPPLPPPAPVPVPMPSAVHVSAHAAALFSGVRSSAAASNATSAAAAAVAAAVGAAPVPSLPQQHDAGHAAVASGTGPSLFQVAATRPVVAPPLPLGPLPVSFASAFPATRFGAASASAASQAFVPALVSSAVASAASGCFQLAGAGPGPTVRTDSELPSSSSCVFADNSAAAAAVQEIGHLDGAASASETVAASVAVHYSTSADDSEHQDGSAAGAADLGIALTPMMAAARSGSGHHHHHHADGRVTDGFGGPSPTVPAAGLHPSTHVVAPAQTLAHGIMMGAGSGSFVNAFSSSIGGGSGAAQSRFSTLSTAGGVVFVGSAFHASGAPPLGSAPGLVPPPSVSGCSQADAPSSCVPSYAGASSVSLPFAAGSAVAPQPQGLSQGFPAGGRATLPFPVMAVAGVSLVPVPHPVPVSAPANGRFGSLLRGGLPGSAADLQALHGGVADAAAAAASAAAAYFDPDEFLAQ